jgi:hypothetical protein
LNGADLVAAGVLMGKILFFLIGGAAGGDDFVPAKKNGRRFRGGRWVLIERLLCDQAMVTSLER